MKLTTSQTGPQRCVASDWWTVFRLWDLKFEDPKAAWHAVGVSVRLVYWHRKTIYRH